MIRVSPQLYKRLESHARGFDTPAEVITRLLDEYEGVEHGKAAEPKMEADLPKPELRFFPDEEGFRAHLINGGDGKVVLLRSDGSKEHKVWSSVRFKPSSNLRANIWSGYLRGWRENQIIRAEFHVQ